MDYTTEMQSWNWKGFKTDTLHDAIKTLYDNTVEDLRLFELTDHDSVVGRVYLGTVFALYPSGKYYTPFACGNVEPCPECGGDGHARQICDVCWSSDIYAERECNGCHESRPAQEKRVQRCNPCKGTGKRYISELATLRNESYQDCLDYFLSQDINLLWGDTSDSHYILCYSCKSTPAIHGTGKVFVECPTCGGIGSSEVYQDELYQEALDTACDENGFWHESGEGDPCDVFLARSVSHKEIIGYLCDQVLDTVDDWLKKKATIRELKRVKKIARGVRNKLSELA